MSLTSKEWEEMWNAIKKIENYVGFDMTPRKKSIRVHIELIKDKIQQVIGQLE